jgi:RNA polymerase sigma-70 factor (ECF subfamily)
MAKEKGIELAAALASLGTEQREALRLTEEQGYSLAEAARIMGKSLAATKKLRSRALARLARLVMES